MMKRLGILLFGLSPCALGMANSVSTGTQSQTLAPSTVAVLTVVATCFGMWLRLRVSRKAK